MQLKIQRSWAMPNRQTFKIKPIDEFIRANLRPGFILDPFAHRRSDYGAIKNDINPDADTDFHMDALKWLKLHPDNSVDTVLFDPPYSLRQLKECYDGIGQAITHHQTKHFFSDLKNEIARVLEPEGVCLSFGWNSVGLGNSRGFDLVEILLVSHGGIHNDTMCLKEVKR